MTKTLSRKYLKDRLNNEITITGKFVRYGTKQCERGGTRWSTGLLREVKHLDVTSEVVTDHLWFIMQSRWLDVEIPKDSVVQVTGTIIKYQKSNGVISYGIEKVTNVKVLSKGRAITPCKVWHYKCYKYYKFISDRGTKWFKVSKGKDIQRIMYRHDECTGKFEEIRLKMLEEDLKYRDYILSDDK